LSKLVFSDARVWRYMVNALSKIIEEAVFKVDNDGLKLRAMDPSHVVMVDMLIPASSFEEFDIEGETTIGVSLDDLNKVLKRALKNDALALDVKEETLSIIFKGRFERIFTIPLLSLELEKLPEPKIEFKVSFRALSKTFRDTLKDLEPISEVVEFQASKEKVKIIGSSERGEAEIVLDVEGGSLLELNVSEESQSRYSIDYLKDTIPVSQVTDIVEVSFSTNMPCKISYELPGGGYVAFLIAPRTGE